MLKTMQLTRNSRKRKPSAHKRNSIEKTTRTNYPGNSVNSNVGFKLLNWRLLSSVLISLKHGTLLHQIRRCLFSWNRLRTPFLCLVIGVRRESICKTREVCSRNHLDYQNTLKIQALRGSEILFRKETDQQWSNRSWKIEWTLKWARLKSITMSSTMPSSSIRQRASFLSMVMSTMKAKKTKDKVRNTSQAEWVKHSDKRWKSQTTLHLLGWLVCSDLGLLLRIRISEF